MKKRETVEGFYNICFSLDIKCVEIDGLAGGRKNWFMGNMKLNKKG